jgi:serralysin
MWGDGPMTFTAKGGDDTFVFAGAFGNDFVNDFRQHEDTLEFRVAGVADLRDLVIAFDGQNTVISTPASATDTVTLVGFSGTLTADDFMFC